MNFRAIIYNIIQKWDFHQFWRENSNIWNIRRSPNVSKNVCKTIAFGWPAKTQIFTFAGKPNETISLTFWPFFDRKKYFEKLRFSADFKPLWNYFWQKTLFWLRSVVINIKWDEPVRPPKERPFFRPFWGKTQLSVFMQSHY